jgi:hypothetical protein
MGKAKGKGNGTNAAPASTKSDLKSANQVKVRHILCEKQGKVSISALVFSF